MTATAPVLEVCSLFFERLATASDRLLLLDYDGTIAPFVVDRKAAMPYPSIPELLDCVMTTCRTRVVLVSGRPARELPALLGLRPHPEIWGMYGFERLRCDGDYTCGFLSDDTAEALAEAAARLRREGLGSRIEIKPAGVAVHWRGADLAETDRVRTLAYRTLSPLACRSHLLLSEFDGGMEIRASSCSKEDAVWSLLREVEPDAAVAYLGDDNSDESAFQAVNTRGLSVLVRPTPRPTAARWRLRPPEEVVQFLCDWVRACGGDL